MVFHLTDNEMRWAHAGLNVQRVRMLPYVCYSCYQQEKQGDWNFDLKRVTKI